MDNDNAPMGGPLSDDEQLPGEVPMTDAEVTEVFSSLRIALTAPWEPIAVFGTDASADLERLQVEVQRLRLRDARLTNENEDLKFNRNEVFKYKNELAARVGVLEGQLATASEELERQRWYGEQLQMSIEGCSGNHEDIQLDEEPRDLGHEFLPVNGHPDDDECTHRADGTDDTYCGEPKAAHCLALGLDGGGSDA